ncbi:MAG: STAS domain-containing protein [Bacteroidota bacterium]
MNKISVSCFINLRTSPVYKLKTVQMEMEQHTYSLLNDHKDDILSDWIKDQKDYFQFRDEMIADEDLRKEAEEFLNIFIDTLKYGKSEIKHPAFKKVKRFLVEMTKSRALLGYTARETGMFILSLKRAVNPVLQKHYQDDLGKLIKETDIINMLVDEISMVIFEFYLEERERIISRQKEELLESSIPVIKIWEGILGVPIIGTLDSARALHLMETLLPMIQETGYTIAIIDISGVTTLDTLTAQHILKTAAASKMMGATCILCGIKPQIAQTMVSLDLNLGELKTKGNMKEAIQYALELLEEMEHKYMDKEPEERKN